MIKAILLDWGGVLIDDPSPGIIKYCSKVLAVAPEALIAHGSRFLPDFQKGHIDEATFWKAVCRSLEVPTPESPSLWREAFDAAYAPKEEVFRLIAQLHASGYRTAVLSNTEIPATVHFQEPRYRRFDALVLSCRVGARKPEHEIYRIALKQLAVQGSEALFFDDKQENIDSAREVGLHAVPVDAKTDIAAVLRRFDIRAHAAR